MILPGYYCAKCDGFNGEAKETMRVCRYCGTERVEVITTKEARELALLVLKGQPKSYVEAAQKLARFVEEGTKTIRTF